MWARAEYSFSRWQRPHRLDETFVEAMYPCWDVGAPGNRPYITVVSSGPYGFYTVYIGKRFQYLIAHPPQTWQDDLAGRALVYGPAALERYNGGADPNSPGNASCILSMANLRGLDCIPRARKSSST